MSNMPSLAAQYRNAASISSAVRGSMRVHAPPARLIRDTSEWGSVRENRLSNVRHMPMSRSIASVARTVWGVLFGFGNNLQRYIVTASMPGAPDFANGMSIAFGNVGIAVGTAVGGMAITMFSIRAAASVACLFAAILLALLPARVRLGDRSRRNPSNQPTI
nr:hypothetical protein [Bifidobacterium ramosum]